jgi:hypothetical protein
MGSDFTKICILISIFLILPLAANAQETAFGQNTKNAEFTDIQPIEKGFTPDISIRLGTSFTSIAPGYNTFGTFVAPEFIFPISNRFAISAGIGYSNMFYSSSEGFFKSQPMNYGSVYVSGSYKMNEKITISGTGYKTFLINPPDPVVENNNLFNDYSNQGMILNMDYKINENFHINASFQLHQQNGSPYYIYPGVSPSPFNNMGGFTPFNNQGFYPGF